MVKEPIQTDCKQEEESAHAEDLTEHRLGKDRRLSVARLMMHHSLRWRLCGKRHCTLGVHNEVDPKHLSYSKRRFSSHKRAKEHEETCSHIDSQLEEQESLDVLV